MNPCAYSTLVTVGLRPLIALLALAGFLVINQSSFAGGTPEPKYKGKLLGDWLLDLERGQPPELSFEPFRHFDSNAVPFLVHIVQQTDISLGNLPMAVRVMRKRKGQEPSQQLFGRIRADAALAIGEIGPSAAAAIPSLITALQDDYPEVIASSAISLGRILPRDTNAVAALAAVLDGRKFDPAVAGWPASYAKLSSLKAAEALASTATTNRIKLLRTECILALAQIGLDSPETIQLLAQHLATESTAVRMNVMGKIGGLGEPVIPVLLAWSKGTDSITQPALAGKVWQWGMWEKHLTTNELVIAALLTMLQDPNPRVRAQAALALAFTRPVSEGTLNALIDALEDPDPYVRIQTAHALYHLGELAKPALPALQKAARSEDHQLAQPAARAIKTIQGTK